MIRSLLSFTLPALESLKISQMVDSGSRKSAKLWKSGITVLEDAPQLLTNYSSEML